MGGNNMIADIGSGMVLRPIPHLNEGVSKIKFSNTPLTANLFYRRNLNPRYSVRLNLSASQFQDRDADNRNRVIQGRNLIADAVIFETALLFEYNFIDINAEQKFAQSPYIFAGIAGYGTPKYSLVNTYNGSTTSFEADQLTTVNSQEDGLDFGLAIPIGLGYKYKRDRMVYFAELGFRYSFSDQLDHSTSENISNVFPSGIDSAVLSEIQNQTATRSQIGDPNNNDWYVHLTFGATYSFGRQKCYCN
ncbi:MAG: hypothetical protein C4K58_04540 [Flavobacteriaceae bacterium]|nr:MAG: hypothetical protein C4K58_04540 [Flavobacteriaceae bacterium]